MNLLNEELHQGSDTNIRIKGCMISAEHYFQLNLSITIVCKKLLQGDVKQFRNDQKYKRFRQVALKGS